MTTKISSNSISYPITVNPTSVEIPQGGLKWIDKANGSIIGKQKVINMITVAWEEFRNKQLFLDDPVDRFGDLFEEGKQIKPTQYEGNLNHRLENKLQEMDTMTAYDKIKYITDQLILDQAKNSYSAEDGQLKSQRLVNIKIAKDQRKKIFEDQQWKAQLSNLYTQMWQAVKHMVEGTGEVNFTRLNEIILKKQNITPAVITQLSRVNIEKVNQCLENVRILMSKKADEMRLMRELYGKEARYTDEIKRDVSENQKRGYEATSVFSEKLNKKVHTQNLSQEADAISKYLAIQKRMISAEPSKIKNTIRRIMVKDILSEASHTKARLRKEERMRSGKWSEPIKYPQKPKIKSHKQTLVEKARADKAQKNIDQQIQLEQKRKLQEKNAPSSIATKFFKEYRQSNSQGECFDIATRYKNLFY